MSAISPGELLSVVGIADVLTVLDSNLEILTRRIWKRLPTYQNGVATTIIGAPTSGARVLDEVWVDALKGVFVCTAPGTPGTWLQIVPAVVSAEPSSGTIPTGYAIMDTSAGWSIKVHAGSYVWTNNRGTHHGTQNAGPIMDDDWLPGEFFWGIDHKVTKVVVNVGIASTGTDMKFGIYVNGGLSTEVTLAAAATRVETTLAVAVPAGQPVRWRCTQSPAATENTASAVSIDFIADPD